LGGLLYLYGAQHNVAASGDKLFPVIALQYMPPIVSIIFIIALISALFPSADGAITALTSSFCIDILGMQRKTDWSDQKKKKVRQRIHLVMAAIFLLFVLVFYEVNNPNMIGVILKVASYTYGPLLGLFAFGILTKRQVKDSIVPAICVVAPAICYFLDKFQASIFGSFQIGYEMLIYNGLLTYIGLLIFSGKQSTSV
jgi:Na+/proline symporter